MALRVPHGLLQTLTTITLTQTFLINSHGSGLYKPPASVQDKGYRQLGYIIPSDLQRGYTFTHLQVQNSFSSTPFPGLIPIDHSEDGTPSNPDLPSPPTLIRKDPVGRISNLLREAAAFGKLKVRGRIRNWINLIILG